MNILSMELRVKVKTLAAEGRIIRGQECKQRGHIKRAFQRLATVESTVGLLCPPGEEEVLIRGYIKGHREQRNSLRKHRKGTVRTEARNTQLAHGFLKGRSYQQMEQWHRFNNGPNLQKIADMVKKFTPRVKGDNRNFPEMIKEWYTFPQYEWKTQGEMSGGGMKSPNTFAARASKKVSA